MSQIRSEVLYISLDGIMDPLGYSQVLKYLQHLSNEHKINLITFEKKDNLENSTALAKAESDCLNHNICWYKLKYRNGFLGLGQILNLLSIIFVPLIIFIKKNISLVHIRSYMPGIAIPFLKIFFKFKLIFDIRGFWPDEKHDRLGWDQISFKYKFFKRLEVYLMVKADCIITLTHASKEIIKKNFRTPDAVIEVIPTCVDFNEFRPIENKEKDELFTIGYLGSADTAYDFKKFCFLVDQVQVYLDKKINLKVLTSSNFDEIARSFSFKNLNKVKVDVKFVERQSLSHEISSFNLLGFFLKENFSVQASMPTKIGEILACGIPLICNSFNSDIEGLIKKNKVGLTYDFRKQLTNKDLNRIFSLVYDPNTSLNCINTAKRYFSLYEGSLKYNRIYSKFT